MFLAYTVATLLQNLIIPYVSATTTWLDIAFEFYLYLVQHIKKVSLIITYFVGVTPRYNNLSLLSVSLLRICTKRLIQVHGFKPASVDIFTHRNKNLEPDTWSPFVLPERTTLKYPWLSAILSRLFCIPANSINTNCSPHIPQQKPTINQTPISASLLFSPKAPSSTLFHSTSCRVISFYAWPL